MHADIIQENNIHTQSNLSTVSELSEMKPNLVDRTYKLLCQGASRLTDCNFILRTLYSDMY